MEIDALLEALKDFDKKGKKEVSPVLDQFLCHVAKTGETMVSWSQFKNYFLFKLEKVMEDFRASAPEQRGPANPNVESVPFEEMKERILKIVNGYNGIPFTIQRLCELLTDPKRNYTGTEKFLRGVEKNVMVVSCVYPTSEKNGCSGVNRMNGVMLPGNTSVFTERKVNGPGTPRPLTRPKLSSSSSLATNGLPDSTENKESNIAAGHNKLVSDASVSGSSLSGSIKNKHADEDEDMEGEQQEVKRLKFTEDGGEEEDDVVDEPISETLRPAPPESASSVQETDSPSSMTEEKDEEREEEESEAATSTAGCEDQEPSSTQSDCAPADDQEGCTAEREVPCGSTSPAEEPSDMDQSEQQAPASSPEQREGEEPSEPVSSSSSSSSGDESGLSSNESSGGQAPSSSAADSPTEGDVESGELDSESTEEPMEQD
ncbi:serine/threonine-protein phosphatase 4 regulatory subunit 2-B [Colossoma macropomum]|uniref:serine/threonine-protein phosphatase 4 regulatory subunit 2-B n=1 Tax=Colossoma macropomum TaxID=42526 RepID=UPI00186512D8|nr:serine/threonine-protein phosphatase 4 regulatory subunit 2-B [Colossoma macropomum]